MIDNYPTQFSNEYWTIHITKSENGELELRVNPLTEGSGSEIGLKSLNSLMSQAVAVVEVGMDTESS